mgnify:CR=1 FL=1
MAYIQENSPFRRQKLSAKAARDKAERDLAFAKTFSRKRKKAENQRLRRAAIKSDHASKRFESIKENRGNGGRGTRSEGK